MSAATPLSPLSAYSLDTLLDAVHEDFSIRALNCFHYLGVRTIGELLTKTPGDILRLKNVGKQTLREIQTIMRKHGFPMKGDPEAPGQRALSVHFIWDNRRLPERLVFKRQNSAFVPLGQVLYVEVEE